MKIKRVVPFRRCLIAAATLACIPTATAACRDGGAFVELAVAARQDRAKIEVGKPEAKTAESKAAAEIAERVERALQLLDECRTEALARREIVRMLVPRALHFGGPAPARISNAVALAQVPAVDGYRNGTVGAAVHGNDDARLPSILRFVNRWHPGSIEAVAAQHLDVVTDQQYIEMVDKAYEEYIKSEGSEVGVPFALITGQPGDRIVGMTVAQEVNMSPAQAQQVTATGRKLAAANARAAKIKRSITIDAKDVTDERVLNVVYENPRAEPKKRKIRELSKMVERFKKIDKESGSKDDKKCDTSSSFSKSKKATGFNVGLCAGYGARFGDNTFRVGGLIEAHTGGKINPKDDRKGQDGACVANLKSKLGFGVKIEGGRYVTPGCEAYVVLGLMGTKYSLSQCGAYAQKGKADANAFDTFGKGFNERVAAKEPDENTDEADLPIKLDDDSKEEKGKTNEKDKKGEKSGTVKKTKFRPRFGLGVRTYIEGNTYVSLELTFDPSVKVGSIDKNGITASVRSTRLGINVGTTF
jgi:hypothetical protein